MSKPVYKYNPGTLTYDRVYISIGQRLWKLLRQLIIGIGMGVIFFGIAIYAFESPHEKQLKKDNKLLNTQYELLKRRIAENEKILAELQLRDDMLYRAIFNADPIPESIRRPGFGGTNRYEQLMNMPNSELVIATTRSLDIMSREIYIQTKSYDELAILSKRNEERMKCTPAIVPIHVKDTKQYSSGWGMRNHPMTGVYQMHAGIDITANSGTPIYATGDGVVELSDWNGNYGWCVIIDHGFGYKTLYGHCREKSALKKGQKVTRGQKIAIVGSTGLSKGPHVHYEVIVKGNKDNPAKYFMELSPQEYNEVLFISETR